MDDVTAAALPAQPPRSTADRMAERVTVESLKPSTGWTTISNVMTRLEALTVVEREWRFGRQARLRREE